jgi:hypothetical protein
MVDGQKICVDCRHFVPFRGHAYPAECMHPTNLSVNLVTGAISSSLPPRTLRIDGACGRGAAWFEPKPPKAPGVLTCLLRGLLG